VSYSWWNYTSVNVTEENHEKHWEAAVFNMWRNHVLVITEEEILKTKQNALKRGSGYEHLETLYKNWYCVWKSISRNLRIRERASQGGCANELMTVTALGKTCKHLHKRQNFTRMVLAITSDETCTHYWRKSRETPGQHTVPQRNYIRSCLTEVHIGNYCWRKSWEFSRKAGVQWSVDH
jgi:hypothetical protein